jgi:ferredoxin-NADP reductase
MSLPNFKYEVCLSRLEPTLKAQSGRLTGEFVSQHVIDLVSPTFFLCGPSGFMDNAHQILSTLGVDPDRILQESFGETKRSTEFAHGKPARPKPLCSFTRRRFLRLPPGAPCWIWRRKMGCRYRMAAARA